MRYVFGLVRSDAVVVAALLLTMVGLGVVAMGTKSAPAGDRADRLERIETTLADVLERVKRIEGFVGKPTPAPAIEAAHRGKPPKFDPSAPLPVNPRTGRSELVEAMEQAARDYDEAREDGRIK